MISLDLSVSRILLKFVISVTVVWSSGVSFKDYSMESAHKHIYSQVVMHEFHVHTEIFFIPTIEDWRRATVINNSTEEIPRATHGSLAYMFDF